MLDFRIHTFLTVCNCMNYTKAAEQLHITQPAVSQHIRYLEDLYQVKLFIHDGKKIQLSPAGEILYHTATTLKNDESLMQEKMHCADPEIIPFHCGITMTIGEFVLSEPLALYQKDHPETDIQMIFANTVDLLSRLRSGELNFALIEGYFENNEFSSINFNTEPFVPVCSSKHQFEKEPEYLSDLFTERLIVREEGSGTRNILTKNLDARNRKLSDFAGVSEIGSMHTIIDFIKKDCGITFLYRIAAQKELASGEFIELNLKDFHVQHNFSFIWNKGSIYTPQYEDICKQLQNYYSIVY